MDVIFVGRLIWAKGCTDLIEVCQRLWDKHDFTLWIVGDGPYASELVKLAGQRYGNRTQFWGELSREDVMNTLKSADLFVNPSYSEGLPTSVMEAASVGLPIIATDVGGTREIIENGKTGMLYPPHDVEALTDYMEWAIENPVLAKAMGKRAQECVCQKFNWDVITQQWECLLKTIS